MIQTSKISNILEIYVPHNFTKTKGHKPDIFHLYIDHHNYLYPWLCHDLNVMAIKG